MVEERKLESDVRKSQELMRRNPGLGRLPGGGSAGSVNASSGGGSSIPNIFIVQSFQRNARVFVITFRKR